MLLKGVFTYFLNFLSKFDLGIFYLTEYLKLNFKNKTS